MLPALYMQLRGKSREKLVELHNHSITEAYASFCLAIFLELQTQDSIVSVYLSARSRLHGPQGTSINNWKYKK